MSIITVEFDNKLEKSKIIMPLLSSSYKEAGENYHDSNLTDKAQTSVFGIQAPLIQIGTTIIDFDSVHYFSLKSTGKLPELVMTVEDKYSIIANINNPTSDNEVRVQILPRFDNAYKKIDLTFYISNIQVTGNLIRLVCVYKIPKLISSQLKSYGEIDTYSLFKNVAMETDLGFATNISKLNDLRYVYCDNKSLLDMMNDEIQYANSTEHIIDWWIDFWDNINLVDVKERYESIDRNEDMLIWIAGQINETTVDRPVQAIQTPAVVNNLPHFNNSELYVKSYSINTKSGSNVSKGTDKVYGIYNENDKEHFDYLIQYGDVKDDIFTKYDYIGENYSDYNYLLAKQLRDAFIQKMFIETVDISLQSPLLGLMRGHKLNFIRYLNDDFLEGKISNLEKAGVIDRNVESNIPLQEYELDSDGTGKFRIDKCISAQYLILGVNITFSNNKWDYILNLGKPAISKVSILNNEQ
jgi:hypothetical protein